MEISFSDELQIEVLKKHGYEIREEVETHTLTSSRHDITAFEAPVLCVYKDGEKVTLNYYGPPPYHIYVNYVFKKILHEKIYKLLID